jgi:hypothetical protein
VDKLAEDFGTLSHAYRYRESLIGAVSAGFFLVLLGVLFIATPGLFSRTIDFFEGFGSVVVPNTTISFLAPTHPLSHRVVYTAAEQFCFAFGVFHVVILALRFAARSSTDKKADTIGNLIFWIGAGYLIRTLLIEATRWTALTTWFVFWAVLITLIGVTLIARAIILAATIPRRIM